MEQFNCQICGKPVEKEKGMCIDVMTKRYGEIHYYWCGECSYELDEFNEPKERVK
ncbi:hypothetical protein [Paenibacillus xylanexedens]|uniref:hypothetical protein n=1 Tax=Paenibacillus xylanexedens TaxID=528191 RepID=UPI00142DAE4F|nr:hypothetical protein [Paenibacillus xylanexedens]